MPWAEILELIGPGLQYNIPRERLVWALAEAERRGRADVAHHLRIILKRRDIVRFDQGSSLSIGAGQKDDVAPVVAPASATPKA